MEFALKQRIIPGKTLIFLDEIQECPDPVVRVYFLHLRPFSFFEFLEAANPFVTSCIDEFSLNKTPDELQHKTLLNLVRRYLLKGC